MDESNVNFDSDLVREFVKLLEMRQKARRVKRLLNCRRIKISTFLVSNS